jgi:hypothetical protein
MRKHRKRTLPWIWLLHGFGELLRFAIRDPELADEVGKGWALHRKGSYQDGGMPIFWTMAR